MAVTRAGGCSDRATAAAFSADPGTAHEQLQKHRRRFYVPTARRAMQEGSLRERQRSYSAHRCRGITNAAARRGPRRAHCVLC
eukprot:355418-Chlamydomonas_euryale.AAC.3